jgi:hypothetical protein
MSSEYEIKLSARCNEDHAEVMVSHLNHALEPFWAGIEHVGRGRIEITVELEACHLPAAENDAERLCAEMIKEAGYPILVSSVRPCR